MVVIKGGPLILSYPEMFTLNYPLRRLTSAGWVYFCLKINELLFGYMEIMLYVS